MQSDGKIVTVGFYLYGPSLDSAYFTIARFNSNGSLNNSFNGNGKQTGNFGGIKSFPLSIVVQPDGKILVSGRAALYGINSFGFARYNANGTLDHSFSGDGKQITSFDTQSFFPSAVSVQNDGKIIVAGTADDLSRFVLAHYKSNGDLDSTFSEDGLQTSSSSVGSHMAINTDGRIAVGGPGFNLALYKKDGTPDSSFNGNGFQTSSLGLTSGVIYGVTFDKNKLYAVGQAAFPGGLGVVSRVLVDGPGCPCTPFVTAANGNWNNPATWVGGVVPSSTSEVLIHHIVTVSSDVQCYSLKAEGNGNITIATGVHFTILH